MSHFFVSSPITSVLLKVMQSAQSSSSCEIFESILSLPDFDLLLKDQCIFLAEGLLYQSSKYLCASASAWLIFFLLAVDGYFLLFEKQLACFSPPK